MVVFKENDISLMRFVSICLNMFAFYYKDCSWRGGLGRKDNIERKNWLGINEKIAVRFKSRVVLCGFSQAPHVRVLRVCRVHCGS
jgi:hypothetical protein